MQVIARPEVSMSTASDLHSRMYSRSNSQISSKVGSYPDLTLGKLDVREQGLSLAFDKIHYSDWTQGPLTKDRSWDGRLVGSCSQLLCGLRVVLCHGSLR